MVELRPHHVAGLPPRWVSRISRELSKALEAGPRVRDPRAAYVERSYERFEALAGSLRGLSIEEGDVSSSRPRDPSALVALPVDASDGEIVSLADRCADRCATEVFRHGRSAIVIRARCDDIAHSVGIAPIRAAIDDGPAIGRYLFRGWWRRVLRASHGRALEESGRALGIVHRRLDPYVTNEGLRSFVQQCRRNARILEATTATNEDGEVYTLAELAARSVSNKAIRRGELMLRIRGMEDAAKARGMVALFAVLTCPSRMHAYHAHGEANAKHDRTSPRAAQGWHAANWKRMTAALLRAGVAFYGVRTVEPHHDATPHWNVLLFLPPDRVAEVKWLFRSHWLNRWDGGEAGAIRHRVRLVDIDPAMGSAAGYVAKYIAKGIDGAGLETDLLGVDINEAVKRVEAWARRHGIRQFQVIGGPPVTLWRELRRVPREAVVAVDPPEQLVLAWNAAQKFERADSPHLSGDLAAPGSGPETARRADFGAFIEACGGPRVSRRDMPIVLRMKPGEGVTRYGEEAPPKPVGVACTGHALRWKAFDGIAALGGVEGVEWREVVSVEVDSVRRTWTIGRGATASAFEGFGVPRTRVNNYTRPDLGEQVACWSTVDAEGFDIGSIGGEFCDWPPRWPPDRPSAVENDDAGSHRQGWRGDPIVESGEGVPRR